MTQQLFLYKLQYSFDSVKKDTVISETRYHFFVYKKGDKFGFDYDSHKSPKGQKVSLDSIFKHEWIIQNKLYPMFGNANDVKLISSYKSNNLDTLKEKYFIKSKTDSNQSGFAFLEFSNSLKGIDFSLSKELDSIKNMKMYKIGIQYNPIKINDSMTIDKFETAYEFFITKQFDKEEIFNYFEKFRVEK